MYLGAPTMLPQLILPPQPAIPYQFFTAFCATNQFQPMQKIDITANQ